MARLWQFETARFTVFCDAEDEMDPDVSWADEQTLRLLESGVYVNICWHVGVEQDGHEIGASYLGNSVYENPSDFVREHLGSNGTGCGGYFPGMVREAIAQARETLRREAIETIREMIGNSDLVMSPEQAEALRLLRS